LRGVGLGLFDEAAAMTKFTTWSAEHDAQVAKRQGAHKKARLESRNQPVVRKVVEAPVAVAVEAPVAEAQEAPVAVAVEAPVVEAQEAPITEETKAAE
jgi:small subunit ribosomal protein S16